MSDDKIKLPHSLSLDECKNLTLTGATEVLRFDEENAELETSRGRIVVQGQELKLRTLSLDGGKVSITGQIDAIFYEQPKPAGRLRRFWE